MTCDFVLPVSYCLIPILLSNIDRQSGFWSVEKYSNFAERLGCEFVELNVQSDHVQLLVKVPLKVSILKLMGMLKGRTTLQIFR